LTRVEVEELAVGLRAMAVAQEPVHLASIARKLGVTQIRTADIVEDGRVRRTSNELVIEIKEGQPFSRRRFTLAHELAHLILDQDNRRMGVLHEREPGRRRAEEEDLCDAIAGAVLVPESALRSLSGDSDLYSLYRVGQIASRLRCSTSAVVARISDVLGCPMILCDFQLRTEAPRPGHAPLQREALPQLRPLSKRPDGMRGAIRLLGPLPPSGDSRPDGRRRIVSLKIGGRRGTARVDVSLRPEKGFVLLSEFELRDG
jgi:Zn-dependent peptidase ImmA (M78 family)